MVVCAGDTGLGLGDVPAGEHSHAFGTEAVENNAPGPAHGDPSFPAPCRPERCFVTSENSTASLCLYR